MTRQNDRHVTTVGISHGVTEGIPGSVTPWLPAGTVMNVAKCWECDWINRDTDLRRLLVQVRCHESRHLNAAV